jgi:hypothetical protein
MRRKKLVGDESPFGFLSPTLKNPRSWPSVFNLWGGGAGGYSWSGEPSEAGELRRPSLEFRLFKEYGEGASAFRGGGVLDDLPQERAGFVKNGSVSCSRLARVSVENCELPTVREDRGVGEGVEALSTTILLRSPSPLNISPKSSSSSSLCKSRYPSVGNCPCGCVCARVRVKS